MASHPLLVRGAIGSAAAVAPVIVHDVPGMLKEKDGFSATGGQMSLVPVLFIGFALAICAAPVLLLRRPKQPGTLAPPPIIRNAWIAQSMRLSALVPLFVLGAAGDLWPVTGAAVAFWIGVGLVGRLRLPLATARANGGRPQATFHAALAQACGDDSRVRRGAAVASVFALVGLATAEAVVLVVLVTPLIGAGSAIPCFAVLVAAAGLYGVPLGTRDAWYVSQALLGAILVGLFGSTALLLYLSATDLRSMPPHGALALLALIACCAVILSYRQTKYIETPRLIPPDEASRWRRALGHLTRLVQRSANLVVSVLAALVIVLAAMQVYVVGLPEIARGALAALGAAPRIPLVGCLAIVLLALTYPIVDLTSRQNASALIDSARAGGIEEGADAALVSREIRLVGGETALLCMVFAAFGALAALSTDLPPDNAGIAEFVGQLIVFDNEVSEAALTLLLVACFAMATSVMGAALSTALTAIRLDILPAAPPQPGEPAARGPAGGLAAVGLWAIIILASIGWIASGALWSALADGRFFAPALAFACLQLSLLPLLLARLSGVTIGEGPALAMLGGAIVAGLGSVAVHGVTGDALWLWLAVPACLLTGLMVLAASLLRARAVAPRG